MRVVIDTNVVISAFFFKGTPRKIIDMWLFEKFKIIASQDIIKEYVDVIDDFKKKHKENISPYSAAALVEHTEIIKVNLKRKISRDPDDDKFVNCAIVGGVDYIVSGDKDLLVLEEVSGIKILSPKDFYSSL